MKSLISFRTEEENKRRLIEKADRLGLTVSDILDNILSSDLNRETDMQEKEILFNQAKRILFLRVQLIKMYELALEIKAGKKDAGFDSLQIDELIKLILHAHSRHKKLAEKISPIDNEI